MHERKVCKISVFCLIVMVLTVVDQKHRKANLRLSKAGTYIKKWPIIIFRSSHLPSLISSHLLIPHFLIFKFCFLVPFLHRHISLPHTFIIYCTHKHFFTVRPIWTLSHAETFLHSSFFTNTFTNSSFLHAEAATNWLTFYPHRFFHKKSLDTQTLLHSSFFTPESSMRSKFCIQILLPHTGGSSHS